MDRFTGPPPSFSRRSPSGHTRVSGHPQILLPPNASSGAPPSRLPSNDWSPGPVFHDGTASYTYSPTFQTAILSRGKFGAVGSHRSRKPRNISSTAAQGSVDPRHLKDLVAASNADEELYQKVGDVQDYNRDVQPKKDAREPATNLALGKTTTDPQHTSESEAVVPNGSIVYLVKAVYLTWLNAAVRKSTWSNKEGANQVIQTAWLKKPKDAKILFLFCLATPYHSGSFRGLAQMTGPYDARAQTTFPSSSNHSVRGAIPIKWITLKDVPFSAFSDVLHKDKPVTEIRHCNTIPGEIGVLTVERYLSAAEQKPALLLSASETRNAPFRQHRAANDATRGGSRTRGKRQGPRQESGWRPSASEQGKAKAGRREYGWGR